MKKPQAWVMVAAVLAGLLLAKNVLIKLAVSQGIKAVTGLDVQIGGLDVGLFNTRVSAKNVRVMNPAGFEDRVMVSLPELYVDYDLGSIVKGKPHLETVRVHLAELVVVKNQQGQVNVNSLRPIQEERQAKAPPAEQRERPARAPELHVDLLELQVGRVVYKDYAQPTPSVKEFTVNIQERYEHITSPQALASMIVMRSLAKTTIARLAGVDLGALKSAVEHGIQGVVGDVLNQAIGSDGASTLKSFFQRSSE